MATGNFSIPGRVSPAQQNASDSSTNVSRKTKEPTKSTETAPDPASTKVSLAGDYNILNNYRTVTYTFTLAGLEKRHLDDPESYRDKEDLKLVILKSGGKGPSMMEHTPSTDDPNFNKEANAQVGKGSKQASRNPGPQTHNAKYFADKFFDGFNRLSPGRFDMFMENVEIEGTISPSEKTSTTVATKIKFDVIEPYSINGFLEALHTAAVAAGYPSYQGASFLFKIEFWGYPDNEDFPDPVKIPNSTRYFPITITEANIEITEKGTLYRCNAVPYNERSFGHPNVVKKPIKMQGTTIGEILKNFFKALDESSKAIQEIENKEAGVTSKEWDRYEIKFPTWDDKKGWVFDKENKIAKSKMGSVLTDPLLVGMNQPKGESESKDKPTSVPFKPEDSVVQFDQDTNINEIITAIVKDSEYAKDLLKGLNEGKPGVPDQYGFVEYWLIRIETRNSNETNTLGQKPFQTFTYLVSPYKVHYTRIPGYSRERIKEKDLEQIALRSYNFMYTGKNIDVLNFKLNFNNLFYDAVPVGLGDSPSDGKSGAAAPANTTKPKLNSKPAEVSKGNRDAGQVPDPAIKIISQKIAAYGKDNATPPSDDPYQLLAKTMHEAVINSKSSMLTGELEILGDPLYLAGSGAGNWNAKPGKRGQTLSGEVNQNYGAVLVTITFRNPEDINSFEDGGMFKFDNNKVPFSGVYQITTVVSTFKDGVFKQQLKVMRMPGQVLDSDLRSSDPRDRMQLEPKQGAQVVPDETRAMSPEQRADSRSVETVLSRGLPTPDTTFTVGGLGGAALSPLTAGLPLSKLPTPGVDLLSQTPGLSSLPTSVSSVVGNSLPTDLTSNIRLNTSGLADLGQSALKVNQTAATISSAANIIKGNGLTTLLGSTLAVSAINSVRNISNQGSGIGKGATVSIAPITGLSDIYTSNEIKQGSNISSSILPSGSISNPVSNIAGSISGALTNIGSNVGSLIGGVGNKITALTSLPTDPKGISASVGLDPSKLSGLGGNLQSKLPSQVSSIINSIPKNVNLKQAASQGLVLDYIPASKVANIPATPPLSKAPIAQPDPAYANQVVARGGMKALENLYGVNSPSKLSSSLVPGDLIASAEQSLSKSRLSPFGNLSGLSNAVDLNAAKDKLGSFQTQLSGLTGNIKIPDSNVLGSVASKFSGGALNTSPLSSLVENVKNSTGRIT